MSAPGIHLVVEIAGKRGRQIERVTLTQTGLTIGRAWDSDIIVQDKYVDASQLKMYLDENNQPRIVDFGSTNGSTIESTALSNDAVIYHWGSNIAVGDTVLRIFDASTAVAETTNRSVWYNLLEPFQSPRAMLLIGLVAALLLMLNGWAFSKEPMSFLDLIARFAVVVALFAGWTLIASSVSKIARGQANMRAHWVLVCAAAILVTILSFLLTVLRFNLQEPTLGSWLSTVVYALVVVAVMFALLTYSSHLGGRAKWLWSILFVSAVVIRTYSDTFLLEEHELWNQRAEAEQATLPPALMFRKPVSLDDYFGATDDLFESVKGS